MYSTTKTALLSGIQTIPITVEVDLSAGMPVFDMVGYLSSEVREAKERIRTALHNSKIALPPKRITVNLYPANVRKSGTGFDLPIAVALLCALGILNEEFAADYFWIGELGLGGQILPVNGILPMVSEGRDRGIYKFVVPRENQQEAKLVTGVEIISFDSITQLLEGIICEENCSQNDGGQMVRQGLGDFSEIHGQKYLRRAAEIAASGMHNMLMIGAPGAGKTMISQRIPTILPAMNENEQLETSKVYSVCGKLQTQGHLMTQRPFCNPHYSITEKGLLGGGRVPKPGEISLAHNGVLFLDELTEFKKPTLEMLRQPLEEREVRIVRSESAVRYPADFLLVAAMNPCNCGYYPNMQKCRCSPATLQRYFNKISQPLIDRIDLCVEAPSVCYDELVSSEYEESSSQIRERVSRCHEIQKKRYAGENFCYNSKIPASQISTYCRLSKSMQEYMEEVFKRQELTARTYHKVLRVARTIADMSGGTEIQEEHLKEAVCFRTLDKKFWGGDMG